LFLAAGCELSLPHLMPVKRHFVRCLGLVQHRPLHLRKRTYLGTIRTTANQWTSQHHCNRRCCLIQKVYSMDRELTRCHYYIQYHLSTLLGLLPFPFFVLSLCCSLPVCCRCMHVSLSVLLLPLCRSNAIVHVIRLVLYIAFAYVQKWAISLRIIVCFLSGNRSFSLANASLQLGYGHGRACMASKLDRWFWLRNRQIFLGTLGSTSASLARLRAAMA
jgi:hypothetical protein